MYIHFDTESITTQSLSCNKLDRETFEKIIGEREMLITRILSHMLCTLQGTLSSFVLSYILSSTDVLNFE